MSHASAQPPPDLRLPADGTPHTDGADDSPWRRRFEAIYKSLRRRIILLEYPPGMRLDVAALAEEFDVSRTPIRSVVQRLEGEGLAVTRHGVGTAVTEIDFDQVQDAMRFRMHLAELIGRLNPRPARVAVLDQLEKLREVCEALDGDLTPQDFARIDMRLHDFKCNLIGNEHLRKTYDEMYYRAMRAWFYYLPRMDWPTEIRALGEDIRMTIAALRGDDVEAVGFLTRNAISGGLYRLNALKASGPQEDSDEVE